MKRLFPASLLLVLLTISAPARANIVAAQEKLNAGIAQCKAGEYAKGVDVIVDAAMDARRADPKHAINNQWRGHLITCFNQWSDREAGTCATQKTQAAYQDLFKVYEKAGVLAGKDAARKIERKLETCLGQLVTAHEKQCAAQKASLDLLIKLEAQATRPADRAKVSRAVKTCREGRWKTLTEQCRTTFSPAFLSEVEVLYPLLPASSTTREQFRGCLMTQVQGARELCRTRMAYREGFSVYNRAFDALKQLKPIDEAFLAKVAPWKDECGMHRLQLKVRVQAFTGKTRFEYPAQADLVVTRSADNGQVKACGVMQFPTHNAVDGACDVTVTVPQEKPAQDSPFGGRHWICLTGKIITGQGKSGIARLRLEFDTTVARPLVSEQIQWTCPGKPAVIFKEKLFETLFSNRKFLAHLELRDQISAQFRLQEEGTRNRSVVYSGQWQIQKW
ncbi:hypothetical protein KKD52_05515 [Myxococcota bacterium]|nr:hypothetical protein [Myxococcota bacterium]MBU1410328.1 hypothetical protein [Myxococcota bacterium]MBU1509798.1 hypothetical protein [Myxococcota bacterium]